MRNVQELELLTDSYLLYLFSPYFVESVSSLTKNFNSSFKLQSSTAFGNLKSLRLVKILFPSADITEKLLSDCGVLENLSLEYCRFPVMNVLNISAHKLRKFAFVNLNNWSKKIVQFEGGLKVHAPSLVSFCYVGRVLCPCEFSNMSLNSASIEIYCEIYSTYYSALLPMVCCIASTKELSLSAAFVLFFSSEFCGLNWNFTPFHYLRSLKLELI